MESEQGSGDNERKPMHEMTLAARSGDPRHSQEKSQPTEKQVQDSVYDILPRFVRDLEPKSQVEFMFTAMLAVSTLLLGAFTFGLWYETHRLAEGETASEEATRERLELEQRAWVTVTSIHTLGDFSDSKDSRFEVIASNTGHTPAINVKMWVGHVYTGYEIKMAREIAEFSKGKESIKDTIRGIVAQGVPLHAERVTDSSTYISFKKALGDAPFYLNVFGAIEYEDIFGKKHFTEFYFYRTSTDLKEDIGFTVGAFGNETDESRKKHSE